MNILQDAVSPFGLTASQLLGSTSASPTLRSNTTEASDRGAFGVPRYVGGNESCCEFHLCTCNYYDAVFMLMKSYIGEQTEFFLLKGPWD